MSRYLLSVHVADDKPQRMTGEQMRQGFERIAALEGEMTAADALVFSGRLTDAREARVVRPSRGRIHTTDGPYAETKEQLGGFYVIEAPDAGAALEWGSRVSLAINSPIEVRPFFDAR